MSEALADYRYSDPAALVARQFSLIEVVQAALRTSLVDGVPADMDSKAIRKLMDMSQALSRNMDSLKKYSDLAEELQRRMSPEQLLEAAMKKVEGQDIPTIRYALRRLKAQLDRLEAFAVPASDRATDAIASL